MQNAHILNTVVSGSGPTIVFLHGYLASAAYWDPIARRLQPSHRVIQVDLLGFGHSPKPKDADYTTKQHADSLHLTLKNLGITKFTLVGHSMGCQVALQFTKNHPRAVTKLLLINPPLFNGPEETKRELINTNLLYWLTLYTPLNRIIWPAIYAWGRVPILNLLLKPNFRGKNSISAHHSPTARVKTLANTVEITPIFDLINTVKMPATILVGKYDRDIYLENLKLIKKRLNIKIELFDTGHHIPQTYPEAVSNIATNS